MSLHTRDLLAQWWPQRDDGDWVMGTITAIEGPSYRKPGALMLFGPDGQQYGLLSGGCLESDISLKARQVLALGKAQAITYDGNDENDISFRLGIGCGGTIHIFLQRVSKDNQYLYLDRVLEALQARRAVTHWLNLDHSSAGEQAKLRQAGDTPASVGTESTGEGEWFVNPLHPPPLLLVVGGGVDARPLVHMANTLGWDVAVCDPRPANARAEHFPEARYTLREDPADLSGNPLFGQVDAAVVMTHNLNLDARALQSLAGSKAHYLALLGPVHRKQEVLELAGLNGDSFPVTLAGPAGLALGGERPESVALSILAECHASLYNSSAASLSLANI